jgi:hypothetical protein
VIIYVVFWPQRHVPAGAAAGERYREPQMTHLDRER